MKKVLFLLTISLICFSVYGQKKLTGNLVITCGKPFYPLNKKVLTQVTEEVYFSTLGKYGKALSNKVSTMSKDQSATGLNILKGSECIPIDTLPFSCPKAGFMGPSGWQSDFMGDNPKPEFTISGAPNTGWPKLSNSQRIDPNLLPDESDFTLIIWPLLSYYSRSKGSPPFSGENTTVSLIAYGIYNSKTGELIHVDYVKAENLFASKKIEEAYGEMLQKTASKLIEAINKIEMK